MSFVCIDCKVDTLKIGEYYMINDTTWPLRRNGGMLCIGCLETRLGYKLQSRDFTDAPINSGKGFCHQSKRLRNRINLS